MSRDYREEIAIEERYYLYLAKGYPPKVAEKMAMSKKDAFNRQKEENDGC